MTISKDPWALVLRNMPTSWNPLPLKRFLLRNDSGVWGEEPDGEGGVPVVRSTDITMGGGWSLTAPATRKLTLGERRQSRLQVGDIVVVKSSGSEDHIGKAAIVDEDVAAIEPSFSNFTQRLRPKDLHCSRYLWYLLNSSFAREQFSWLGTTTTGLRNLNASLLGALWHPGPPVPEQERIADFLDGETARIDAVISKRQRMMDVLEERFWGEFVERVSAISSNLVPMRRVLTWITDGPFGSAFSANDYSTKGASVVRLGNIGFAEYRAQDQAFISLTLYKSFLRHRVLEGDLLIAGLGDDRNHAGRACIAPNLGPAIVKGKCFCARVSPVRASAGYVAWFLSSPAGAESVKSAARGSTRSMINLEIMKEVLVPLPDLAAQEEIADWMGERRAEARRAVATLQRHIELLQEHRQALITAAVTGQIEVAEAAA